MIKRDATYYLLGSPLVGFGVADNFYLTAPSPLGPYTNRGLFVPKGSNSFSSQTFQGLSISGPKGEVHVFIGHRWGALHPPFPNATSIWLPLKFADSKRDLGSSIAGAGAADGGSISSAGAVGGGGGGLEQLEWYSEWDLDTAGAWHGTQPEDNRVD